MTTPLYEYRFAYTAPISGATGTIRVQAADVLRAMSRAVDVALRIGVVIDERDPVVVRVD